MATQLFKFITPRDPKQVSEDTSNLVLDIGQLTGIAGYSTSLMASLSSIFASTTLTAAEKVTQLNTRLNTFAGGSHYLADIEAFDAQFGVFGNYHETAQKSLKASLAAGETGETVVAALVADATTKFSYDPARGWLRDADLLVIVDNLLFQMLSVAEPAITNKLSTTLKLYNLLKRASATGASINVRTALKLLKLPIGVPANFKVPNVPRPPREAVDDAELIAAIAAKHAHYEAVIAAYEELVEAIESQATARAAAEPLEPSEPGGLVRGGTLTAPAFDPSLLTSATRDLLAVIGVDEDAGEKALLKGVRKAGADAAKDLASHIPVGKKSVVIGGVVYAVEQLKEVLSEVIWNEEETGGVVIAGHGRCGLRFPFKIANLRVVEQDLLGYEPGHIAHIQNTLQGEFNEKTTRRLLRTEETFTSSFERESTEERDTQTTDRFTLEREASRTIQEDTEKFIKGELKAAYGPVSLSINAGYSNSTSIEESNAEAVSYTKEVMQRSLSRLIEKTREERSIKTINEFEETNRHGLDNRNGDAHVVGVYRWLDELKEVRIKTYDTRMMIEIMIPQPAKFHLSNFIENKDIEVSEEEPVHPAKLLPMGIASHKDINSFNYATLAASYGASIDPMPQEFKAITHVVADGGNKTGTVTNLKESKDLIIPAGYRAYQILSTWSADNGGSYANHSHVGGNWVNSTGVVGGLAPVNYEGTVNVVTVRWNSAFLGLSLHVTCKLTDEAYELWQIKTYNAIISAYDKKKAAYDNAVAEAKANSGVRIRGTNPAYNKQLIRTELKKQALYLMSHCKFIDNVMVYDDGRVASCCEAFDKGQVIKFVDSVFEWDNLMYVLYDYFYAKKAEWSMLYNISDPDPLMNNFLRAGEARVIIPVAKGKETAVINFLMLGKPWISDLLSMDILDVADTFIEEDEIEEILVYGDPTDDQPELKPLVTPTTLTILECSSGGVTPDKYLIRGVTCEPAQMKPVLPAEDHEHTA
jgi:hypothetical protein